MHVPDLISLIAVAFTAAWVLGIVTQSLKLSPIVGYLLAGIVIGPYTPGYVGDDKLAVQLSELGVILLMFGVGLHFHLGDLLAVRRVAVPGAIGQSLVATLLGGVVALLFGWEFKSGLVLGMAMAVASTVVLIRVLTDNKKLDTPHGHVAVGWLIVEDILTVIVLVLIPALGTPPVTTDGHAAGASHSLPIALLIALVKLVVLVAVVLVVGGKVVPWIMIQVTRLRSRELFTLTILVMAIAVAAGSAHFFGASMALGAFLGGMVVGQTAVSQQATADLLPLRDAFAVLFFTSVGMLFDPRFIVDQPLLLAGGLAVVLIAKPLAALVIVALLRYPARTALTVAVGLGQIGEFSFILSDLARNYGLLNDSAHNLLVACAIVSITLNPLLFRALPTIEHGLRRWPLLWRFLENAKHGRGVTNPAANTLLNADAAKPIAVVLGYGPAGRAVDAILRERGVEPVIVDMNMDTIAALTAQGRPAIYGDAYNIEVLGQAVGQATHLIITLPHSANRSPLIAAAKLINPDLRVIVRARYLAEADDLRQVGADHVAYEEAEVAVALATLVMTEHNVDADTIGRTRQRLRGELRPA